MDDRSLEDLTHRPAAAPSRRAAVAAAVAGLTDLLLGGRGERASARRKRRKNKRSRPGCASCSACRRPREACSSTAGETCCAGLACATSGCGGDATCVQPEGGACADVCDCRSGLQCSDRAGNTCRACTLLQNPCQAHDECCLASAACGSNIYGPGVCCQQRGFACGLDSDCCANTGSCGPNGCGGVERVCCNGQGVQCTSSCECCDPLRCLSGTCQ
jgi:hypothetical protein